MEDFVGSICKGISKWLKGVAESLRLSQISKEFPAEKKALTNVSSESSYQEAKGHIISEYFIRVFTFLLHFYFLGQDVEGIYGDSLGIFMPSSFVLFHLSITCFDPKSFACILIGGLHAMPLLTFTTPLHHFT